MRNESRIKYENLKINFNQIIDEPPYFILTKNKTSITAIQVTKKMTKMEG